MLRSEAVYQDAFSVEMTRLKIPFEREMANFAPSSA
jgi:hypothetical protein